MPGSLWLTQTEMDWQHGENCIIGLSTHPHTTMPLLLHKLLKCKITKPCTAYCHKEKAISQELMLEE